MSNTVYITKNESLFFNGVKRIAGERSVLHDGLSSTVRAALLLFYAQFQDHDNFQFQPMKN